ELLVKIAKDKLEFLNANKQITGGQQSISPDAFRTLTEIYSSKLEVLNLEILKRQRLISTYNQDLIRLKNQLNSIQSKSTQASSTIFVTISAKNAKKAKINFSYTTDKASWTPTYDIRFEGNDKPLSISYKANISQTTGVDWRGVNISLSTAKTDMSAQIPTLEPLYVRWKPTDISSVLQGRVAGVQIQQESAAPGAGSEVRIRGLASVGDAQNPLYIVDGVVMSDVSDLDKDAIDRVEVLKDASATAIYGSRASNGVVLITTKKNKGTMNRPLTISSKTETAMEFMVDALQTIESNNKSTTVTYRETTLPASFEYQSVPKLSENVFLIGSIKDWYKQDLLSAEVNVYLGNSFIGKSTLNTEQFTDTLQVSFGADNNISIKRERVVEFSENQFIGSSRKQTIAHRITIRNNKAYAITSKITDQIPISRDKEIEVSPLELSGAILESENGKLTWEVALQSNETKEMLIKYTVKSPKNRSVVLE
ncbi:MAG: hypothetical protein RIS47_1944, partial [Bacteroidota bacterium]